MSHLLCARPGWPEGTPWSSIEARPAQAPGRPCRYATLQRPQERDQIILLRLGEAQVEPLVVEVHGVGQRGRRAIVEVRRPPGQPAQDRSLEAPDVLPLAGDERPA